MNLNITKYVRRDIKHYIKLLFLCTVSLSNILASLHISYFFATNEINLVFTLTNGGNYTAVYLSLYPGIKVGTLAPYCYCYCSIISACIGTHPLEVFLNCPLMSRFGYLISVTLVLS